MRFWRADPGQPPGVGADSVFVGATRYTGPLTWLRLLPRWNRMVEQMRRLPGYRAHGVYLEPPWSLGTVGFFATQDDLMTFARTGEHRELMSWVVGEDRRHATGGYIRVYQVVDAPPAESEAAGTDHAIHAADVKVGRPVDGEDVDAHR